MADECLPKTIEDREYQKFTCNDDDNVAVRTIGTGEFTFSGLGIAGRVTIVSVNDATWTQLPATSLASRNGLSIQNLSGVAIKVNYDNTEPGYVGVVIPDGGERFYNITDAIPIYAKSASGTVDVTIEELS